MFMDWKPQPGKYVSSSQFDTWVNTTPINIPARYFTEIDYSKISMER